MISNGAYAPNSVMGQILLASQRVSRCPAWNAAGTLLVTPTDRHRFGVVVVYRGH